MAARGNQPGRQREKSEPTKKPVTKAQYTGPRAASLTMGQTFYALDEGHQEIQVGKTDVRTQGPWIVQGITENGIMALHVVLKAQHKFPSEARVSLSQPS